MRKCLANWARRPPRGSRENGRVTPWPPRDGPYIDVTSIGDAMTSIGDATTKLGAPASEAFVIDRLRATEEATKKAIFDSLARGNRWYPQPPRCPQPAVVRTAFIDARTDALIVKPPATPNPEPADA